MKRVVILVLLASLAGCGVKSDLVKPNGQATPRETRDPSQPVNPIGR